MTFNFLFQFLQIIFLDGIRTQFNFLASLATARLTSYLRNHQLTFVSGMLIGNPKTLVRSLRTNLDSWR